MPHYIAAKVTYVKGIIADLTTEDDVSKPDINFTMPTHWVAKHFWHGSAGGAFGFSVAIGPCFAIGVEFICLSETKGLAIIVGPLWLGFARYQPKHAEQCP